MALFACRPCRNRVYRSARGRFSDLVHCSKSLLERQSRRSWQDLPICDIWFDQLEHLFGRLVDFDEDAIVDLQQAKELEDFPGLRGNLGDTRVQLARTLVL